MKKTIISLLIMPVMLLSACNENDTSVAVTTPPTEINTTYDITTLPTETTTSAVTTITEETTIPISEADLWITEEYAEDIERITEEAEESYTIYNDNYEGVGLLSLRVYLSLADISADGIPEVFTGYGNDREQVLYSAYSYDNLKYIDIYFLSSEFGDIFDNKKYISDDGKEYYYAVIFTSNATNKAYRITKIWYQNNQWFTEEMDINNEDLILPEKFEPLITSTVQINPDDVKGSVEQCFIEYFSQIENHVEAEQ